MEAEFSEIYKHISDIENDIEDRKRRDKFKYNKDILEKWFTEKFINCLDDKMIFTQNIFNVQFSVEGRSYAKIKWSKPHWKQNFFQKLFKQEFQFSKRLSATPCDYYYICYKEDHLENLQLLKKAIIQANGFQEINKPIEEPLIEEETKAKEELAAYLGIAIN